MTSRGKGQGRVIQRRPGVWAISVELDRDPTTGQRRQHWETIKGTKRDAEKHLVTLIGNLNSGTFVKPSKANLISFLDEWMHVAKANLAPKTIQNYSSMIKTHISPSMIAQMPLTEISPGHIQAYINLLRESGLGARTARHHFMLLHGVFETALKWGRISRNPVGVLDPPRFDRPEMKTLRDEDLARVLSSVKGTVYHPIFAMALFTGARRSEYLAIKWGDVDLKAGTMSITRSVHYVNSAIVFSETKTAKSRRIIALTPTLIRLLETHKTEQRSLALMFDQEFNQDRLVFCHQDGNPILPDTVTRHWIRTIRKLGLNVRLHDARHTMATLMLREGIHPKIVAERLGHSSVSQTLDTYSHVTPSMGKAAAFQLDQAIAEELEKAHAV